MNRDHNKSHKYTNEGTTQPEMQENNALIIHGERDKKNSNTGELCLMCGGILCTDFTTDEINALMNLLCTT